MSEPKELEILQIGLDEVLKKFSAQMGTLHRFDESTQMLHLVAAAGSIPPPVLEATRNIPIGKGIAGQAAKDRRPVSICNLQAKSDGALPSGAKKSGSFGSLCVPILIEDKLVGTLGIGCHYEKEFSAQETESLIESGKSLAALMPVFLFILISCLSSLSFSQKAPKSTADLLKKGKAAYTTSCVICHGEKGDGNGVQGQAMNPKPRSFITGKFKNGGKPEELFKTITNGLEGTAMAGFESIPEEDRWGLVYFIKKFKKGK